MILTEQFIRSVNIWKLSDGESIKDKYVDMYLYLKELTKDIRYSEKNGDGHIILVNDSNNLPLFNIEYNHIIISYGNFYIKFVEKFNLIYSDNMDIIKKFMDSFMNIKCDYIYHRTYL